MQDDNLPLWAQWLTAQAQATQAEQRLLRARLDHVSGLGDAPSQALHDAATSLRLLADRLFQEYLQQLERSRTTRGDPPPSGGCGQE